MKFPPHLINADGKPKHGTAIMAQWLGSLHVHKDFPCTCWGFDMRDGKRFCRDCGVELIVITHHTIHPNTPMARLAHRHPDMFV
jgi:hypothetical protein